MTLEEQIQKMTAERDAALKQVAEMRWALRQDHAWSVVAILKKLLDAHSHLDNIHDCDHYGWEEYKEAATEGKRALPALEKVAASSDCGKGYHHDDEWRPVVEALRSMSALVIHHHAASDDGTGSLICDVCAGIGKQNWSYYDQALAHVEKLMSK